MTKTATITEALAEYKTNGKRIASKRTFVAANLLRPDALKDPLAKEEGGSTGVIMRERQAIRDLEEVQVSIRRAIAQVNGTETITVNGVTRTIADWLVWRRDVAPAAQQFALTIASGIERERKRLTNATVTSDPTKLAKPTDVFVNVDEAALAKEVEDFDNVLGTLDGLLSLKNATIPVTY